MRKGDLSCLRAAGSFIGKILLPGLLFLYTGISSFAQTSVVIGNTTGTSSYLYGPYVATTANSNSNYSRFAYLYTDSELGIPYGATITEIAWLKAAGSGTVSGNNTFTMWLANTTDASFATSVPWSQLTGTAGLSQEYTSTTRSMMAAGDNYEVFPLSGSFTYTGDNLLILTEWAILGALSSTNNFYRNTASGKAVGITGNAAHGTSLRSNMGNNRPTIRITYVFTPTTCSGQPYPAYLTIDSLALPRCTGSRFTITAADTNIAAGIVHQWQDSLPGGAWANVSSGTGATDLVYTTDQLSATTYFRIVTTCTSSGVSAVSEAYRAWIVGQGQVTGVTNGSRCGPGTVSLSAAGTPAGVFNWYDASGDYLGSGNPFTTPFINTTTTYQVAVTTGDTAHVGFRDKVGTSTQRSSNQGLIFDAYVPFTLQTVAIYPTGPGTEPVTISLKNASGGTLQTRTVTVAGTGERTVVPLNFSVPEGSGLQLVLGTALPTTWGLNRESGSGTSFPYTLPGVLSIVNGSTANNYMFFYDWVVTTGCESPQVSVTATVGSSPAFNITTPQVACYNGIATLSVTSVVADFDSYTWTPTTDLYTDPGATVPYTGGSATEVYVRRTTPGNISYAANAANSITDCSGTDTTEVFVQPAHAEIIAPAFLCVSGAATLNLVPDAGYAPGTIQWQQSANGSNYSDISGADGIAYTTPTINTTTYYRAQIKNSAGAACLEPVIMETVHNPQLLGTVPGTRCGPGTVTLSASASAGSSISWYDSPAGGSKLETGNSFTTPVIHSSQTYYATATNSTTVHTGMPDPVNASAQSSSGLRFDAYMPFTLDSVDIYPIGTGSGTVTINLLNAANATLHSKTVTVTGTSTGVKNRVDLGFSVPAGNGHRLVLASVTGGVTGLLRTTSSSSIFPHTVPGVVSITGSSSGSGNLYYFFYDWVVTTSCEGARVPVTASVTPGPGIAISPAAPVVCRGGSVTLMASSVNAGYTYEWSPGNLTGTSITVSPTVTTTYYITATDNSGGGNHGCITLDSVRVIVNDPPSASATASGPTEICEGESVMLTANTGIGYTYQWQRNDTDINGAVQSIYIAETPGTYRVLVTEGGACTAPSNPVVVTVHPLPQPGIISSGPDAPLTTGLFVMYQWFRDGAPIAGATNRTHMAVENGNYTVSVTDQNGCVGISSPYQYTVGVASVGSMGDKIRIYPNPVAGKLYVDAPEDVNIAVSSMEGKLLLYRESTVSVDVSHLPDGMYMVQVLSKEGYLLRVERLVKK